MKNRPFQLKGLRHGGMCAVQASAKKNRPFQLKGLRHAKFANLMSVTEESPFPIERIKTYDSSLRSRPWCLENRPFQLKGLIGVVRVTGQAICLTASE